MSVTQKEIAEKLNMSQSHVARALKDDPIVSARTRLLVQTTAKEMGYDSESNHAARVMASRRFGQKVRTGTVAVIFPPEFDFAPEDESPRFIPFYRAILNAMHQEAAQWGMDLCVFPCHGNTLPRLVRDRNVDGVIVIRLWKALAEELRKLKLPVVTFHEEYEQSHSVTPDDYHGACQATSHLIELGHREIAYFGASAEMGKAQAERLRGFRETMRENSLEVREEWVETSLPLPKTTDEALCVGCGECAVCCGWDVLQSRFGGSQGAPLPFTAMICHNDPIAMSIITQASGQGYRVPNDFSVVGFDNVSRLYHFRPELTSIDLGRAELGRHAMRMLHQVIEEDGEAGVPHTNFKHLVCPVSLVVHESTQIPTRLRAASEAALVVRG